MRAGVVTNSQLVAEIHRAALLACSLVYWPDGLDRNRARVFVHSFLADHTQYVEDLDLQVIKLPRAFVLDGVGDCKSSAVFACAFLSAAGYSVALRFIRQASRPWLSHVYAVADGVAVDPLLPLGVEPARTSFIDLWL